MEQLQLADDSDETPDEAVVPVLDWCAWCFAPAEEGPIVNGRRYCCGTHAKRDQG